MSTNDIQLTSSLAASSSQDSAMISRYIPGIPLMNDASSLQVGVDFFRGSERQGGGLRFILPGNGKEILVNLSPDLAEHLESSDLLKQRRIVVHLVQEVVKTLEVYDHIGELNASLVDQEVKFSATAYVVDKKLGKKTARAVIKLFKKETSYGITRTPLELTSLKLFESLEHTKCIRRVAEMAASILGIRNEWGMIALNALLNAQGADKETILKDHFSGLGFEGVQNKIILRNGRVKVILENEVPLGSGVYKICRAAIKFSGKEIGKCKDKVTYMPKNPYNIDGFITDVVKSVHYSKILQNNPEERHLFAQYKSFFYRLPGSRKLRATLMSQYANGGELKKHLRLLYPVEQRNYARDLVKAGTIMEREGLIHRDLKPANLLVSDGKIIVSDYGLMTEVRRLENDPNFRPLGSPKYLAPYLPGIPSEQYVSKQDHFAVGLILLEICTRERFNPSTLFNSEKRCADGMKVNALRRRLELLTENPLAGVIVGLLDPNPRRRIKMSDANAILESIENADFNRYQRQIFNLFDSNP